MAQDQVVVPLAEVEIRRQARAAARRQLADLAHPLPEHLPLEAEAAAALAARTEETQRREQEAQLLAAATASLETEVP